MKFSFKFKLISLSVFMSFVSILIGLVSFNGLHKVETSYDEVTDGVLPNLNLINNMYLEFRSVRINLRSLGLPHLTNEEAKKYIAEVEKSIEAFEKYDAQYREFPFAPGEKELYDNLHSNWVSFKALGIRAVGLYKQGGPESTAQLDKIFRVDCVAEADRMDSAVSKIKNFHIKNGERFTSEAKSAGSNTNQLVLLVSILGIVLGMGVGIIFASKVSASIQSVAQQLASNADQVAAASSQIASSSQELSEATSEQAASLEQTAASLEEISSMIAKATDSAETTSASSAESQQKAEQGREAVDQMLSSMDDISQSNEAILNQINDSNRQMGEIVKVIQDIGNRTKVINEIVFQTKLLSFNASVEAARAGEHGKGFAVVAEEVGNLAQMSGNAAKEITDMLGASISKVEGIVKETQEKVGVLVQNGKEKVDSGVSVARQCSEVLNEIVQNVARVSGLSQEITQAAKEQTQGVREINQAVSQLDTVTQQNAATSEEAASAAEELSAQAESLKDSVGELMAVITGQRKAVESSGRDSNVVPFAQAKAKKTQPDFKVNALPEKPAADTDGVPDRTSEGFKRA